MLKKIFKKYPKWVYLLILLAIILFIISAISITTSFKYKKKLDNTNMIVFTFEGKNEFITLDDGVIIITPDKHQLFGGNFEYIGLKDENINLYATELYLKDSQGRKTIWTNSVSFHGKDFNTSLAEVLKLNKTVGEISSQTLFNKDELKKIKNHLFFQLKYEKTDGEVEAIDLQLNVKEYPSR